MIDGTCKFHRGNVTKKFLHIPWISTWIKQMIDGTCKFHRGNVTKMFLHTPYTIDFNMD